MADQSSQTRQPGLVVITSEQPLPHEAETLAALCEAGCQRIHLRRPHGGLSALRQLVSDLSPQQRRLCSVHGPSQWARALDCGGYHGPEAIHQPGLRASRSWHQLEEPTSGCDYGFLSPVFASISKPGYQPKWTLSQAQAHAGQWPCPVYALGGIQPEGLGQIRQAGFAGAAVLGWLWQEGGTAAVLNRWRELCQAWSECTA